jgi:hypothetical protein
MVGSHSPAHYRRSAGAVPRNESSALAFDEHLCHTGIESSDL